MAKADRKHHGAGLQGKGDGTGALTELEDGAVPKNKILSNRDKARHSEERGFDGRNALNQEYRDHAGNRRRED